jgi:hypothetical protein
MNATTRTDGVLLPWHPLGGGQRPEHLFRVSLVLRWLFLMVAVGLFTYGLSVTRPSAALVAIGLELGVVARAAASWLGWVAWRDRPAGRPWRIRPAEVGAFTIVDAAAASLVVDVTIDAWGRAGAVAALVIAVTLAAVTVGSALEERARGAAPVAIAARLLPGLAQSSFLTWFATRDGLLSGAQQGAALAAALLPWVAIALCRRPYDARRTG